MIVIHHIKHVNPVLVHYAMKLLKFSFILNEKVYLKRETLSVVHIKNLRPISNPM